MNESIVDQIAKRLQFRTGTELARACERSRKSASRWRKAGFPPEIQLRLLEIATERGVELSPKDLRNA